MSSAPSWEDSHLVGCEYGQRDVGRKHSLELVLPGCDDASRGLAMLKIGDEVVALLRGDFRDRLAGNTEGELLSGTLTLSMIAVCCSSVIATGFSWL